jgi:DNA-binding transcriptional MocR family regulator
MPQLTKSASFSDNPDDKRDSDSPVYMAGTVPPKVPGVFDDDFTAALRSVLADISPSDLIGSHHFRGSDRARLAGTRLLARRMPDVPSPDRVVVTSSTQSALTTLIAQLVGRGGQLMVDELSYPPVGVFANMLGVTLCPVAMDSEGLIPEAYEAACQAHRPRALYALPTLQNPTTATMSTERREAIAQISRAHDVAIIEDDIYSLLAPQAPPPLSWFAPELSWYVLGTAKTIGAGMKVAYVLAPTADAAGQVFWPGVPVTYWQSGTLNAAAATAMIESDCLERLIQAVRGELRARHHLVAQSLAGSDYRAAPESPHVWLHLPSRLPRVGFAARVLELGAEIGTSDQFVLGDTTVPNAIRFSTSAPPTRDLLQRGLDAITQAYHETTGAK